MAFAESDEERAKIKAESDAYVKRERAALDAEERTLNQMALGGVGFALFVLICLLAAS